MKKNIAVLALALTLAGSLVACSNRDPNTGAGGSVGNNSGATSGTNGSNGTAGSTSGSTSGTAGTVSRRYGSESIYNGRSYFDDGRYTAGTNGQVYGRDNSTAARDLTRDARRRYWRCGPVNRRCYHRHRRLLRHTQLGA